jgi:hypothetical protein
VGGEGSRNFRAKMASISGRRDSTVAQLPRRVPKPSEIYDLQYREGVEGEKKHYRRCKWEDEHLVLLTVKTEISFRPKHSNDLRVRLRRHPRVDFFAY